MALSSKLYASGYWPVRGNQKRSGSHYTTLLPQTLRLIQGEQLVFYSSSEEILSLVEQLCRQHGIVLQAELRLLHSLPAWSLAKRLMQGCRAMQLDLLEKPAAFGAEKAVIHYWRDYKGAGAEVLRQMLTVWLSKIDLITALASEVDHDHLVWIDATIARFNGRRSNWRFWLSADHPDRFCHYGSEMRRYGRHLPLNASYLSGPRLRWSALQQLFNVMAERAALMPYGHDEETILAECVQHSPGWFQRIGLPYTRLAGRPLLQAQLKNRLLACHPRARR